MTTEQGIPIDDKQNVITVGKRGPMLMQDVMYMDEMAHFDRERIPERVVHAKGAGKDVFIMSINNRSKYHIENGSLLCVVDLLWYLLSFSVAINVSL